MQVVVICVLHGPVWVVLAHIVEHWIVVSACGIARRSLALIRNSVSVSGVSSPHGVINESPAPCPPDDLMVAISGSVSFSISLWYAVCRR